MKKDLMIYVHIPYCVRKCNYCDFLSFADDGNIDRYMTALISDPVGKIPGEDEINIDEYVISSVFIGGGTPSLIDSNHIIRLMEKLKNIYEFRNDAEITIEANPGTLTTEKLICYRKAGINRLSMGVQSFDDDELKLLGRIHSKKTVIENFYTARENGFDNINLDLISAIPGQHLDSWENNLKEAIELSPEHISAYSLIVEPGTPICDQSDRFPSLPDEDEEREMYVLTQRLLSEAGYFRYEISNYAKKGYESRHNIGYWTGREYLGLGLGASSYMKSRKYAKDFIRFAAISDMDEFLKNPVSRTMTEIVSPREAMEEYMFLGLRMMRGVSISEFETRFGKTMGEVYGPVLRKYIASGHIIRENDRIRLSNEGISVSNMIFSEFLI